MTTRRRLLQQASAGFGYLAFADMAAAESKLTSHFPAKAKRVIFLCMRGGPSHMETFDPKPMLNKYAGKSVNETPFKDVENSPFVKKNLREVIAGLHTVCRTNIGYCIAVSQAN